MKLFLSPTISNSNEDPVGEYKGPVFCSNDWSNVTRRGGFSNKSNELCVASGNNNVSTHFLLLRRNLIDFFLASFFAKWSFSLMETAFCMLCSSTSFDRLLFVLVEVLLRFVFSLFLQLYFSELASLISFLLQILITRVHLALAILFQLFLLLAK